MYSEYNEEVLNEIRKVELDLLNALVKICDDNNIDYFLTNKTLLGAVKYQSYVPYDNNISVGMTRKNYELFIEATKKELPPIYYLDCYETNPNCYIPYAKLKRNGTTIDEKITHHIKENKGIYINIIPFENLQKEKGPFQALREIFAKATIEAIYIKNKIRKEKINYRFAVKLLLIFSKKRLIKFQQKLFKFNKNNNSLYIVPLSSPYPYKKETIKRSTLEPVKTILFCNREYKGMNDNNTYLYKLFGDYTKLTPQPEQHIPLKLVLSNRKEYHFYSK